MKRYFFCAFIVVMAALALSAPVAAATLQSPFKNTTAPTVKPTGEIFECATPSEAVIDLHITELFEITDPTRSTIVPEKEKQYNQDVAPVNAYLDELTRMANIYTRSNGRNLSSAKCALSWLHAWASQSALSGEASKQGNFVRKWALASISASYIQISLDGRLDSKQRIEVKKWIQSLSQIIINDFAKTTDLNRRNHRLYWAAWAVGISSVVIQNKSNFDWAMEKARIGLIQIEDDGTLPLEVRRGALSQNYHLFATEPLVMLAELGHKNGVNLYGYNKGALHRLAEFNISQLIDSSYLTHRSGKAQKLNTKQLPQLISWLEPYYARFGFSDKKLSLKTEQILRKHRPLIDRRIGGDMTLLFEPKNNSKRRQEQSALVR
jgi:poly(beta-D-mannuronate) lyase